LWSRRALLLASAGALVTHRARAQDVEQRIAVQLEPGHARHFDGAITDFEALNYAVPLAAGQSLQVSLATNHAANCFDIHAPGIEKPVYVGADSGAAHRLVAAITGTYVVRVFLLRFAARDGQSARFSLELKLGG
jgi:hypothetical protein